MASVENYDPRMGDESGDERPIQPVRTQSSHRHVRLKEHPTLEEYEPQAKEGHTPSEHSSETTKKADSTKSAVSPGQWVLAHSPIDLAWIPANWTWSKMKVLIRCALVAWISLLFFIVKRLEILLGQVSGPLRGSVLQVPPGLSQSVCGVVWRPWEHTFPCISAS